MNLSRVADIVARARQRPGRVRQALLFGHTPSLRRRRTIATLSALAMADAALVTLSQMGVVRRLPDPPLKIFDSHAVTTSKPAYLLGVPDAALATCNYALNLVLASAGGSRRGGRSRVWSSVLLASCVGGAIGAAGYLADMLFDQRRLCGYCLGAIGINFALLPLAWNDWRAARTA